MKTIYYITAADQDQLDYIREQNAKHKYNYGYTEYEEMILEARAHYSGSVSEDEIDELLEIAEEEWEAELDRIYWMERRAEYA